MAQGNSGIANAFYHIFIVAILIGLAPIMCWMWSLERFGQGANMDKTNFSIVFCVIIQLILWAGTRSFFVAFGINLVIAIIALCFGFIFGHTPIISYSDNH